VAQEVSAITPGRTLNVPRRDERIPGGLRFTGPGCYRLTLEAQGQRYELAFPVRFRRAA
jgi:hypothetical protein